MDELQLKNWTIDFDGKKVEASVPGDVSADLYRAGIIEDPMFGDNYKKESWVHERNWTYRCIFDLSKEILAHDVLRLNFEGIDTFSTIRLNGVSIGKTESMFLPYSFDVKSILKERENVLEVEIESIRQKQRQFAGKNKDEWLTAFNMERIFFRKVQCHFGWDWTADYPGLGIYLPVSLSYGNKFYINDDVHVRTQNNGLVNISLSTSLNNRKRVDPDCHQGVVKAGIKDEDGNVVATIEKEVFGACQSLTLKIENPHLWYPNGYGKQPIYNYCIRLFDGDTQVDEKEGTFAFRTIEIREPWNLDGSRGFGIFVNGVRVRCLGGNWVPCSQLTGAIPSQKYEKLVDLAKKGGINMFRVWGGGLYEKNEFYDLCDRAGILIWQDFMFSCQVVPDYDDNFRQTIETEATAQIKRLRNHPCIALWCGGNELSNAFKVVENDHGWYIITVMLAGLVAGLDEDRRYLYNSPYSVSDIGNDATSGDCHKNAHSYALRNNDFENFRDYMPENLNCFDSECAILGMCRLRDFKKFMPEDKLWPQNDMWHLRLFANPHDKTIPDFTERITTMIDVMFGGADSLEDFIKKSMIIHAEVLGGEIDYYRAHEINNGILSWMYNDNIGTGTWSIVDDALEPKPAYYALKRAGKRQRVSVIKEKDGYYVNVVNDTDKAYIGLLLYSQENIDGTEYAKGTLQIKVDAYGQISQKIEVDESKKQSFVYAKINSDECIFFYDLWKDKVFQTDLEHTWKRIDENKLELTIKANAFARSVFIDIPEACGGYAEDNYFDLKKGTAKTVLITTERPVHEDDIGIYTFADVWKD